MTNKNELFLYKYRYYTCFEFRCNDEEYDDTNSYIISMVYHAAKGSNLYVEYYGANSELDDPNVIIKQKQHLNHPFWKTLWMREKWLSVTNKSFIEERWIMLFVCDSDFSWETFLEYGITFFHKLLRMPQVKIIASFGDCEFPRLYVPKQEHLTEIAILDYFKGKGFVLMPRGRFS